MATPNTGLNTWRFYQNDSADVDGCTPIGAEGSTSETWALDTPIMVRFSGYNDGSHNFNEVHSLWARIDGGSWFEVTGSSNNVRSAGTGVGLPNDGDPCDTQILSSYSTYTWDSDGLYDDVDGAIASASHAKTTFWEDQYCVVLRSAELSGGELIEFDNVPGGGTRDTITTYAQITAEAPTEPADYRQKSYAWGDPGTESGHTVGTINTDVEEYSTSANVYKFLRFEVEQYDAAAESGLTVAFELWHRVNGGSWAITPITESTNPVWIAADSNIAHGQDTTNRITGAGASTYTFLTDNNGCSDTDNETASMTFSASSQEHAEILWSLGFNYDELSDNDYIEFQLRDSAGAVLEDYTVSVAKLTWSAPPPSIVVQTSYRARADDGDETGASWLEAADQPWFQQPGLSFRLRGLVKNEGGDAIDQSYKWQYSDDIGEFAYLTYDASDDHAGSAYSPRINAQGSHLAVVNYNISPHVSIYSVDEAAQSIEIIAGALDTSPDGFRSCLCWDPTGTYLLVGGRVSTFVEMYKRSGDAFTKLSDPPTNQPPLDMYAMSWCEADYVAATNCFNSGSPRFLYWKRSGDSLVELSETNVDSFPSQLFYGVRWQPQGDYLVVGASASPYLHLYARSGDDLTYVSGGVDTQPAGLSLTARYNDNMRWDPSGTYFAVSHGGSSVWPGWTVYKLESGVLKKLQAPPQLQGALYQSHALNWDRTGRVIVVGNNSAPYMEAFFRKGDLFSRLPSWTGYPADAGYGFQFSGGNTMMVNLHFSYNRFARHSHGSWLDVSPQSTTSVKVRFVNSTWVTDGEDTTQQLGSGSFVTGDVMESNPSSSIALDSGEETELEAALELVQGEVDEYDFLLFRLVEGASGTPADIYRKTMQGTALSSYIVHSEFRGRQDNGDEDEADWISGVGANDTWDQQADQIFRVRVVVGAELARTRQPLVWQFSDDQDTLTNLSPAPDSPGGYSLGMAWDPSGTYLAVATQTGAVPRCRMYKRADSTFTLTSQPAGSTYDAQHSSGGWDPTGEYVFFTAGTRLTIYQRKKDLLSYAGYAPTALSGTGYRLHVCPAGGYVAVALYGTSPYFNWYSYDSSGIMTKLSNPGTLPDGNCADVAWTPDGSYLACSLQVSPYINFFSRSGSTLTKETSPTAADGICFECAWDPTGIYLAVAISDASPYLNIYKRTGASLSKMTSPTAASGPAYSVAWDPTGRFLAVGISSSPYLEFYEFDADTETFTKLTAPSGAATGTIRTFAWSPSGEYLVTSHDGAPYVQVFQHGSWTDIPAQGAETEAIEFANSTYITDHEVTTQQLGTGTFTAGEMNESNPSNDIVIAKEKETEVEAVLKFRSAVISGEEKFWLRVVGEDGT